jgi:long-chain acyl-CoA synthetase
MSEIKRIFDLHYHQLKNYPKSDALATKENGKWVTYSIQDVINQADEFSLGLLKLSIQPTDKIAIISNNRPEWHITDLGILQLGAINVPIYPTITEEDYAYIMNDAEVKMVFVSDEEILGKVNAIKNQVPSLKEVYSFNKIANTKHWTEVKELGKNEDKSSLQTYRDKVKEDELATLIYTSGTTGKPKGVMISHRNIVSNVFGSKPRLPVDAQAKSLSFLPLCHVYERMVVYLYIYTGVSVYYAESMDTIGDNLREVKPQVFTAVPRLLEKVYDKIMAKGADLTGLKKKLFYWAVELGLKYDPRKNMGFFYNIQLSIANKLIFSKWREALGGNCQAVASGSAPLQPRLARIFLAAKIPVMEGYGLTETSPVLTVNCEDNDGVMIGSVGRPLDNVQIKIAADGEILAKGPNVMMGYYKRPDLTDEVIDKEGWLHTGDIGEFVDGFLKITDRKKEIFKTSGGKYVAPQILENKFKESPFIEQLMVVGEGEKHPSAIIQPAFDYLKEWCKRKEINYTTNEEMVTNEKVKARIQKEIDKYNSFFAKYEQLKKVQLTPTLWSIEGGELTPTLKLRRKPIMEKYKDLYAKIYSEKI